MRIPQWIREGAVVFPVIVGVSLAGTWINYKLGNSTPHETYSFKHLGYEIKVYEDKGSLSNPHRFYFLKDEQRMPERELSTDDGKLVRLPRHNGIFGYSVENLVTTSP